MKLPPVALIDKLANKISKLGDARLLVTWWERRLAHRRILASLLAAIDSPKR